jgi:hypothetical protein
VKTVASVTKRWRFGSVFGSLNASIKPIKGNNQKNIMNNAINAIQPAPANGVVSTAIPIILPNESKTEYLLPPIPPPYGDFQYGDNYTSGRGYIL